jgi:hypothetical protein
MTGGTGFNWYFTDAFDLLRNFNPATDTQTQVL